MARSSTILLFACCLTAAIAQEITCPVDLVIVLDTSGSVVEEFPLQRRFLELVVEHITQEQLDSQVRVGILTFNTVAHKVTGLDEVKTAEELVALATGIEHEGGGTSAGAALPVVIEHIRQHRRADSKLIVMHISDGNSIDSLSQVIAPLGRQLRNELGAEVFAVTYGESPIEAELNAIAGSPRRVYFDLQESTRFSADVYEVLTANECQRPATTPAATDVCKVDLVILLDVSGSQADEFTSTRGFIHDVVNFPSAATYSSGALAVAVVKFGTEGKLVLDLQSNQVKANVVNAVDSVELIGGGTSAVSGVELALDLIAERRRANSLLVVIHVSDGVSGASDTYTKMRAAAQQLRDAGAQVFAVSYSDDFYMPELSTYAGGVSRVYTGERRAQFQADALAVVQQDECRGVTDAPTTAPPATTSVAPSTTTYSGNYNPCMVDLMIVMDVSGSITEDTDFQNEKDFVLEVLEYPTDEWYQSGRLNVGIVKFTTSASVILDMSTSTRESAIKVVTELTSEGGGTSAMSGVRLALDQIRQHRRPNAQVVLFHVSDGNSGATDVFEQVELLGQALRDEGVLGFSMTFSTDAYFDELEVYAGGADRVYQGNLGEQALQQFTDDVLAVTANVEMCGPVETTVAPTTAPPTTAAATTTKKATTVDFQYDPCKVDLMVVMDVSGSITEDADFEDEKNFILEVLNVPSDDWYQTGKLNVGIVKFTTTAEIILPFGKSSRQSAIDTMKGLTSEGGGTSAMSGIRLALQEIRQHRRPDAQVVLLHVSDGNSGALDSIETVKALGQELVSEGIIGFAMTFSTDAYEPELKAYAGDIDRVYRGDQGRDELREFQADILAVTANLNACGVVTTVAPTTAPPTTAAPTTTHKAPTTVDPCKVDLMIVMDVSGSITEDADFEHEKDFILQVLNVPSEEWYQTGRLNVGIVKFTTTAEILLPFGQSSRQSAIDTMTGLTSEGGGTSAMSGIRLALQEIRQHRRPDAQIVLLHVSDGNSGALDSIETVKALGLELETEGIIGFAMTFSTDAYEPELKAYAGDIERVYRGDQGKDELREFQADILAVTANLAACGVAPTTAPPTTTTAAATTTKKATTIDFQYDPCKVDLMIVMDVSGSITEDSDFENEKNFILEVLNVPSEEWYQTGKLNVGIVKFTTTADILLPFGQSTRQSAIDTMTGLTSEGGGTSAMSGIRLALQEIRQHRRPDAQVVLLHVSDGNSGALDAIETVKALGQELEHEGVIGFAMTFSHDAYEPELKAYAGDIERVYRGDQGRDELREFQADILAVTANLAVCGGATPTTTPVPTTAAPTTTAVVDVDPCTVDLLIVIDVSGSITEDTDFQNEKDFILSVLNFPSDVWYNSARLKVGIVKFTTTAEILLPLVESSKGRALDVVASLESEGGGTSAMSGVRLALDQIRQHRRPDAQVVLLHVSDGNSGVLDGIANVKALGQTLEDEGIRGFAMTFSTDAYEPELEAYAGDKDRVYRGDFGADALTQFKQDVLMVAANVDQCGEATTTAAPTTTTTTTTEAPTTIDFQKDTTIAYVAPTTTTPSYVDPNPTTKPPTEAPTTIDFQVDPCTVDLMIVMDVSGSITEDSDFQNEKNFVLDVLDYPSDEWYTTGRMNVGVVKFTTTAEIILPFGESSRARAIDSIFSLESQGGGTSAMTGVRLALKEIREHRRPNAQVVLLHVSDGNSGALDPIDMVKRLGGELEHEGIIAFAMTYSTDAYEPELAAYAGSVDRVYRGDHGQDELTQFKRDVLSVVANIEQCGGAPTTTTTLAPTAAPTTTTLAPTTTTLAPTSPPVYNPCKVDLVVIMDVSGSITEDTDFEKEKAFIQQVLEYPTDEWYQSGKLQVGLIKFTTTAEVVLEYGTTSRSEAAAAITSLKSQGGGTSAMTGVQLALAQIRQHRRPDAQVVLLHVSDGNSGVNDPIDQVVALGRTLKDEGIIGFSMTFSTDAYEPELEAYAGHDDRVYRGDYGPEALVDFQVDVLDIVANLDNCGEVETTTAAPTKPPTTAFVIDTTPLTTTEAPIVITKAPVQPTSGCPIDLMIVLDTSGSVEDEFERQRAFVLAALDVPSAGDYADRLHVSIVSFYSRATLVKPFGQAPKESHFQIVQDIAHTGGATSALTGLRLAIKQIEEGRRPGAQLIVMHVSDGNSQDFLPLIKETGRQLRATGAEVFSITYSSDWYLPELATIAGSDRRVYVGDGGRLDQLESDIGDVLASASCVRDSTPPPVVNRAACTSRVMVVMDASGSVRTAFEKERAFVRQVFDFPEPQAYRDGLVTLGLTRFTTRAHLVIPFSNSQNKTEALDEISAVEFNGGGTSGLSGMRVALEEIKRYQAEPRDTKLPSMAVVLLSDGRSGLMDTFPEMEAMAQALYDEGVTVFAVTFSPDYYLPELVRYTGSVERVYTADRLEQFQQDILAVTYPGECRVTPTLAHLRA